MNTFEDRDVQMTQSPKGHELGRYAVRKCMIGRGNAKYFVYDRNCLVFSAQNVTANMQTPRNITLRCFYSSSFALFRAEPRFRNYRYEKVKTLGMRLQSSEFAQHRPL